MDCSLGSRRRHSVGSRGVCRKPEGRQPALRLVGSGAGRNVEELDVGLSDFSSGRSRWINTGNAVHSICNVRIQREGCLLLTLRLVHVTWVCK